MPTHRTATGLVARFRTVILAAALAGAGAGVGCKGEAKPPATAPAAAGTTTAAFEGVTFSHPAGWKVSATQDGKGLTVTAPDDAGWEPNVFFEFQPNADDKAVDELTASYIELLAARKTDFRVRTRSTEDHPGGFKYGRIEYTNSSEGSPGVPLTQWAIVVPVAGKQRRLQVQAAAATAAWDKYRPAFEQIVDSIRLPK